MAYSLCSNVYFVLTDVLQLTTSAEAIGMPYKVVSPTKKLCMTYHIHAEPHNLDLCHSDHCQVAYVVSYRKYFKIKWSTRTRPDKEVTTPVSRRIHNLLDYKLVYLLRLF